MKLFDVMVFDEKRGTNVVYRGSLIKREAKKLAKELQERGFKSHVLTSRTNRETSNFQIEEAQPDYSDNE